MQLTCNASKLTLPDLPAVITRDRLARRIRAFRSSGLIWIVGQPAQGKTTLAADFLRRTTLPIAWISLDSRDGEALRFYNLLTQALSLAVPAVERQPSFLTSDASEDGRHLAARLADRLLDVWPRLPKQIQIVLDGLDRLEDQATALHLIRILCDAAIRKQGRIWLLSRRRPPFEYQQAIVNRQLLVLNNDDLAFTPREIQIYFEAVHQLNLPQACAEKLYTVTEGWPGGLILAAQALERLPPTQWTDYLSRDLPLSLYPETHRYFHEETLAVQPASIRSFLLHAAVLEDIDALMLADVLDMPDCSEQLMNLVHSNSFIRALPADGSRSVGHRFNPLFREFLQTTFRSTYSPAEQKTFYARIAAHYDDRGDITMAIKWYFMADDYERAAAGLKLISTDLLIRGRFSELAEQIDPFPEDRCLSDPWLFFLRTLTGRISTGTKCLGEFESAFARFSSQNDVRGQMLVLAHLIEAGILLGQPPSTYLGWVEKAETWLERQSATHYYAWAKTLLWLYVGFGYIVSGLDLTRGLSAAHNALVLACKIGNVALATRAAVISALGLAGAGEFEKADEMLSRVPSDPASAALDEYRVLLSMVRVKLSLRRGNLATTRQIIKSVGPEIEAYGLLFLYPAYLEASGFLQIYEGRHVEARATSRYLLDVGLLAGNPIYKGVAHRLSGLIHYYQSNYSQAAAEARQAVSDMELGGPPTLHVMRSKQLLAMALLRLGQNDTAAELLAQIAGFFEQTANPLSLAETYLLLGMWGQAAGQAELSERNLQNGFQIIHARRFDRLVMLSPADMADIGRIAGSYGIEVPERWGGGAPTTAGNPQAALFLPTASECASEGSRTQLVIKTFGGFRVLRNGNTPIGEDEWGGQRPKLLLKAILVRGLREIPKDLLMDDLWPESSPETALQNFKVTLHRLRKILEPGLQKGTGSAYIHLKGNLVSLDRDYCQVDLEQFLSTCKDIKRHILDGALDPVRALGRNLTLLYQGDFLPEEAYAPWVEMKRWALKDEYIEVLLKMADFYLLENQMEAAADYCRTILRIDSCNEAAAQNLIRLYAAQGRLNEAWQVYEHLDHVLRTELGVPPEPATAALIKKMESGEGSGLRNLIPPGENLSAL